MTSERWLGRGVERPSIISNGYRRGPGPRLRALLSECGVSPMDFALFMNVSPQSICNWFVRGVPRQRVDEVAYLLSVTRAWLVTGQGPKYERWTQKCAVFRGIHKSVGAILDGAGRG
jgi:hypothetical protein